MKILSVLGIVILIIIIVIVLIAIALFIRKRIHIYKIVKKAKLRMNSIHPLDIGARYNLQMKMEQLPYEYRKVLYKKGLIMDDRPPLYDKNIASWFF